MVRRASILALTLALVGGLVVAPALVLTFAPLALILLLLTAGVRPGEAALLRLRARRLARRHHPGARRAPRPRLDDVRRPVGHALASALGMRPPPAASAAAR